MAHLSKVGMEDSLSQSDESISVETSTIRIIHPHGLDDERPWGRGEGLSSVSTDG